MVLLTGLLHCVRNDEKKGVRNDEALAPRAYIIYNIHLQIVILRHKTVAVLTKNAVKVKFS